MEKQQASERKIALSYLFSVFAVSFLTAAILQAVFYAVVSQFINPVLEAIIIGIINIAAIFAGISYGSRATKKRYVINNPDSITLLSYIYYLAVWLVLFLPIFIFGINIFNDSGLQPDSGNADMIQSFFGVVLNLVYVAMSRKYLKG